MKPENDPRATMRCASARFEAGGYLTPVQDYPRTCILVSYR